MTRLSYVRSAIVSGRWSGWLGLPWAVAIFALATGLRMAINGYVDGVPFLTYYPAVLMAGVLLGWRWALGALAACAAFANFAFQAPFMAFSFGPKEIVASLSFFLFGILVILATESLRRAVLEVDQGARREAELNLELAHRVQNNLTVVQALADQTARIHAEPREFYTAFRDRLTALSAAHSVLSAGGVGVARLPRLAQAGLGPFLASGQIEVTGAPCTLPPVAAVPLVLALHELATNATKYGALSTSAGRVSLSWRLEQDRCCLAWREALGPKVQAPRRQGLGTRLLRRQPGLETITTSFEPDGVVCRIEVRGCAAD